MAFADIHIFVLNSVGTLRRLSQEEWSAFEQGDQPLGLVDLVSFDDALDAHSADATSLDTPTLGEPSIEGPVLDGSSPSSPRSNEHEPATSLWSDAPALRSHGGSPVFDGSNRNARTLRKTCPIGTTGQARMLFLTIRDGICELVEPLCINVDSYGYVDRRERGDRPLDAPGVIDGRDRFLQRYLRHAHQWHIDHATLLDAFRQSGIS